MNRYNRDSENRNARPDTRFEDANRLGISHGNNSRRGNYTIDSHFNAEEGAYGNEDYDNQSGFNTNAESRNMHPQGRIRSGGASYSGGGYTGSNYYNADENPYGMNYIDRTGYNSGRHYDRNANYNNADYNYGREARGSSYSGNTRDFGHDVNFENTAGMRSPYQNDYESERRYNRPHHRHTDRGPQNSNASRMQHSYGPSDAYRHSPDLRNDYDNYNNDYAPQNRRRRNDDYYR